MLRGFHENEKLTKYIIMLPINRKSTLGLTTVLVSIVLASQASAQWRISRPGSYKLYSNHNVGNGDGIIITASNVTLDLNGFSVSTNARGTGRGIVVENARAVTVSGGGVSGFNANVDLTGTQNVRVEGLRITGDGLAPSGGPTEIGIRLINSWSAYIQNNSISSVNLGIFVRGARSTGNRIAQNTVVGGPTAANNLLGICYNPEGGTAGPEGPRGDAIYSNHIARFGFAIAVSGGSVNNMFTENTLASFTGAFREPQNFVAQGGTNVEIDNTSVTIPSTNLVAP
jgi:parallel beta-helix repeat protein